ncbi:hypothetical protein AB4453_23110 [Vibrio atlanticus]|uniref:hypothetical protein n=1 Tax=Vibrio atlanticus TaxID=693153 RepID=UPI003550AF8F
MNNIELLRPIAKIYAKQSELIEIESNGPSLIRSVGFSEHDSKTIHRVFNYLLRNPQISEEKYLDDMGIDRYKHIRLFTSYSILRSILILEPSTEFEIDNINNVIEVDFIR